MMREMEFVEEKNDEISVLQKLMDYCANNYSQDLSLEILEKELHVNRFYISHLFSQKLKIKFNSYINSLHQKHHHSVNHRGGRHFGINSVKDRGVNRENYFVDENQDGRCDNCTVSYGGSCFCRKR